MQSSWRKNDIIAVSLAALLGLAIADYVDSIWVVLVIAVWGFGLLCLDYYEIRRNKKPTPDD